MTSGHASPPPVFAVSSLPEEPAGGGVAALDPALACAWEEAVTQRGVDAPVAYVWQPSRDAVVLGLSQSAERELNLAAVEADGVQVVRRASGGGAVYFSRGVLCFGVVCPPQALGDSGIHGAFSELTAHVREACGAWGLSVRVAGISDLAAETEASSGVWKKIAGCAQLRKKHAILVHGSLLVDADIARFSRYLAFPSETPDYRAGRGHDSFCTTLSSLLNRTAEAGAAAELVRCHAQARGWRWIAPLSFAAAEAEHLCQEKYVNRDWTIFRKRPVIS